MPKIKVTHIITGLNVGGAEMMLYKLLSSINPDEFTSEVISLTNTGAIGKKIEKLGISVHTLDMKRSIPSAFALLKLVDWLKQSKPDLIQSWMYHADLLAGIAGKLAGNIPVIWGIRQSDLSPKASKLTTILTAKLCARLSCFLPQKIVCCSTIAQQVHLKLGYCANKMLVIFNGFNLEQFKPKTEAKFFVRQLLNLEDNAVIIGLVARFDPQKDHQAFVNAAALLHKNNPKVHFLLCGDGIDSHNKQLMQWINRTGISEKFHLLGRRDNMAQLVAGFDIACSSSAFGEGFPNVIGEAMACAVPCVVTDVGDSAYIVGNTGKVVPPRNPQALADAWQELIDMSVEQRQALGLLARERVVQNFSLSEIVLQYEQLYKQIGCQR